MPQFKVQFGNSPDISKKRVKTQGTQDLHEKVVKAFGFLGDVILQEKDSDDEWMDIDDIDSISDGASLKVIIKPLVVPAPSQEAKVVPEPVAAESEPSAAIPEHAAVESLCSTSTDFR